MDNSGKPADTPPSDKKSNNGFIIAIVVAAAVAIGGAGYIAVSQQNKAQQSSQAQSATPSTAPVSSTASGNIILYGAWSGNNSVIKAYDLDQKQGYLLATLGQNIKRVTLAKPDGFYYIKGVDANDHGSEIAKYSVPAKDSTTVVKAEPGFGIDDYMVSPDGNNIVTWEVQLPPGSKALYGGRSRVYSTAVSNSASKHLIWDEVANKPVHYPRSITNDGKVYTDMFLPNSGFGWAYGMSISDASGQSKQDIPVMANGTYGRQPRVSPDGTKFVFAGYDGSRGSGTEVIGGKKRAIAFPNTVEILDAQTLKRTKLNIPNSSLYDDVRFDANGKSIFITKVLDEKDMRKTQVLVYDLASGSVKEMPDSLGKRGVAILPSGDALMAILNVSPQTLGNLGETYSFVTNNYEVDSMSGGKGTPISANDTNIQYVGMVAASDLSTAVLTEANKEKAKESMQMDTFQLKSNLLKDRLKLESDAAVEAAPAPSGAATDPAAAGADPAAGAAGADPAAGGAAAAGGASAGQSESQAQN
jgi:hypothetical protein